jgi:hypothetical protein
VAPGIHDRLLNDIFGILCKQFFPGIVEYAGTREPAYTFDTTQHSGFTILALQAIPQQGTAGGQQAVGKTSSHYIAYYITFFQQSLNNDCLHHVYM